MRVAFHYTPLSNARKIIATGLVPLIGERSEALGENVPGIYLFPDYESAESAMESWLLDEFEEDEAIALLGVSIPNDVRIQSDVEYELRALDPIAPDCIEVISWNADAELTDNLRERVVDFEKRQASNMQIAATP